MTDEATQVLLIDDEPSIREVTKMTLEATGNWDVSLANSGEEGVEVAANRRFDLILVDFMMPGIDGWETVQQIRQGGAFPDVPVVMFTARGMAQDDEKIRTLKVAKVIKKPFEPMMLGPELLEVLANGTDT